MIVIVAGLISVSLLFVFGKTTHPFPEKKISESNIPVFSIEKKLTELKASLSPEQTMYIASQEQGITRGDVKTQQIEALTNLANFYRDTLNQKEAYVYYTGEAAKLDKSEKNLTFAAHLYLAALRAEHDEAKLSWETGEAINLFEQALKLNPENADLKIGLGSAYIFGRGKTGDPQETMQGVQQLLSVVRADSTNMKAQLVLGIGGFASGQYDKALPRLLKVANAEPGNVEAVAFVADTYAALGNKTEALRWYEKSKVLINNPAYSKEVDERMKNLK